MASDDRAASNLTRRDFFQDLVARLREELTPPLDAFTVRTAPHLVKLAYRNERVHYEVWTNGQLRTMEIGLHFEDGPVSTAAYLAHFDRHIVELKHELGPSIELERWTPSWGHLFEILPCHRLDARMVDRAATRLAALIAIAQPLVEAAAIPPERSAHPPEQHGPWRHWRRGSA